MPEDKTAASPWKRGRLDGKQGPAALLFGRMHEDWTIESAVFPHGGRIFSIASAGDTALALAGQGYQVTAVDINPAQVAYVDERLAGGPMREGSADRMFALGRRALGWVGWTREKRRTFLSMDNSLDQVRFWKEQLDRPLWRLAMAFAFHSLVLRRFYSDDLLQVIPFPFGRVLRQRLERGFQIHPNRTNPYAWRTWLGCNPPDWQPPPAGPLTLICADAVEYLESCPPSSFDGFTLSNILDGPGPEYGERLMQAIHHAAVPGAQVVLRSFGNASNRVEAAWAARDRAMLWGSVRVEG